MPAIEKEIAYRLKKSIDGNRNCEEKQVFREIYFQAKMGTDEL